MVIDFNNIEENVMPNFKEGMGKTALKIFSDSNNKIMKGRLEPGSSIGIHRHENNSEIIFILKGNGKVLYEGEYETLSQGSCHYCPKNHSHSLINDSSEELIFLAVVPEHN